MAKAQKKGKFLIFLISQEKVLRMKNIYMDNVSTTPLDQEVLEEMLPYLKTHFGNPASTHKLGEKPKKGINQAREQVAGLVGSDEDEIIFTSGATESNNMAIKGVLKASARQGKNHIISSPIEHYSVLHCLKSLEKEGIRLTLLDVDEWGQVNPAQVKDSITDNTALVTITHASNEIGTIEPIESIGEITKESGIPFHVDATQTAGNIPTDVNTLNVDLMTISAHQFYGPKGVSALFLRSGTRLSPLIEGGVQESGYRGGMENVAGIVGFGKAAALAKESMQERITKLKCLYSKLKKGIDEEIPHTVFTGHAEKRLPGMLSLCFNYIEGESVLLFLNMENIMVSSGSACASALKSSHVLGAIGISPELSHGSMTLSLGKENTDEDVEIVLSKLPKVVAKLREMSPLYNK